MVKAFKDTFKYFWPAYVWAALCLAMSVYHLVLYNPPINTTEEILKAPLELLLHQQYAWRWGLLGNLSVCYMFIAVGFFGKRIL